MKNKRTQNGNKTNYRRRTGNYFWEITFFLQLLHKINASYFSHENLCESETKKWQQLKGKKKKTRTHTQRF